MDFWINLFTWVSVAVAAIIIIAFVARFASYIVNLADEVAELRRDGRETTQLAAQTAKQQYRTTPPFGDFPRIARDDGRSFFGKMRGESEMPAAAGIQTAPLGFAGLQTGAPDPYAWSPGGDDRVGLGEIKQYGPEDKAMTPPPLPNPPFGPVAEFAQDIIKRPVTVEDVDRRCRAGFHNVDGRIDALTERFEDAIPKLTADLVKLIDIVAKQNTVIRAFAEKAAKADGYADGPKAEKTTPAEADKDPAPSSKTLRFTPVSQREIDARIMTLKGALHAEMDVLSRRVEEAVKLFRTSVKPAPKFDVVNTPNPTA